MKLISMHTEEISPPAPIPHPTAREKQLNNEASDSCGSTHSGQTKTKEGGCGFTSSFKVNRLDRQEGWDCQRTYLKF